MTKKNNTIRLTFLGTGTSQGVPVIGCDCEVCLSTDERDQRLRTSALVEVNGLRLVIDCGPDFRQQMLRASVRSIDAILLTHEHNDHIIGLDDVRPFNFSSWTDMPVYGSARVAAELRHRFAYIFAQNPYPGAPMVRLYTIDAASTFEVEGLPITPVEVYHGDLPVLGYRFGDLTYLTDMKAISDQEFRKLEGTRVLVLNALHHQEHHSHLNLKQALQLIDRVAPERAYLLHLSHRMGLHAEVSRSLPPHIHLAYDGLTIVL